MPPLPTANRPATVTAPDVAVFGVSPVEPNEMVETPAEAALDQTAVPPLTVRTCPVEPMARLAVVLPLAPTTKVPSAVVVCPVPPLPIGRDPVTPVVSGSPVAFVSTSAEGVPSAGVTSVGEVERTTDPVPVDVVTPVPPLRTGSVPVTPVVSGKPVALVRTRAVGVPSAGVTSVGDVERTVEPVPVDVVTPVPPLATASVPASVIVPDVVTGPPLVVRPVVPPLTLMLTTEPAPAGPVGP